MNSGRQPKAVSKNSNAKMTNKAWLHGLFSQMVWGSGGAITKTISFKLPSILLVGLRHTIGALVLSIIVLRSQTERKVLRSLSKKQFLQLLVLGFIAAALPDWLLVEAVRRSGAIIAIMIIRLEIPLGVIMAGLLLREKVTRSAWMATILSVIGIIMISKPSSVNLQNEPEFYGGVGIALLAAVLWAGSGVYAKHLLKTNITPLVLSWIRLSIGGISSLLIAFVLGDQIMQSLNALVISDWLAIAYLGIMLSGLAYLSFYKSMKQLPAHVMAILLSASMVISVLSGLAIGERISILQTVGILTILISIFLLKYSQNSSNLKNEVAD